jgi:hypothetical protein
MQFQNHDEFPQCDHRPRWEEHRRFGATTARAYPGAGGRQKTRRRFWGVYARHSQPQEPSSQPRSSAFLRRAIYRRRRPAGNRETWPMGSGFINSAHCRR